MKTYILLLTALFLITMLNSCLTGQPITKEKTANNQTYAVENLFEKDGCKVYRFYDSNKYVYFTSCLGDVTGFANDSTNTRFENHISLNNYSNKE